jgi:hypothetical protein
MIMYTNEIVFYQHDDLDELLLLMGSVGSMEENISRTRLRRKNFQHEHNPRFLNSQFET